MDRLLEKVHQRNPPIRGCKSALLLVPRTFAVGLLNSCTRTLEALRVNFQVVSLEAPYMGLKAHLPNFIQLEITKLLTRDFHSL